VPEIKTVFDVWEPPVIIPRDSRFKDLTGQTFGRLKVLQYVGKSKNGSRWICRCECGNHRAFLTRDLLSGSSKACGCYRKPRAAPESPPEPVSTPLPPPGKRSPEYLAWKRMWRTTHYLHVPPEAWGSFENFWLDVGKRPSGKHRLCRRDPSKPHGPKNSFWCDN
jgi:hypothetical protein